MITNHNFIVWRSAEGGFEGIQLFEQPLVGAKQYVFVDKNLIKEKFHWHGFNWLELFARLSKEYVASNRV